MTSMIGQWIRPWPGETVVGYIFAVEGDRLHCRAAGGVTFYVDIAAIGMPMGAILEPPFEAAARPVRLTSWGSFGMTPS